MSLRCSLLGHSYGEAEIEREREEQGSEVVVTVREFEECERCGEQNVLSENKEVTALESPAPDLESAEADPDVGSDPDAGPGPDASDSTTANGSADATGTAGVSDSSPGAGNSSPGVSASADPEVDPADDGAEIMTDSPGESGEQPNSPETAAPASGDVGVEAEEVTASDDGVEDASPATDDDGVILDDEESGETDGRRPGEWPDAETTHPAEADEGGHADWPEVGQADEGYDAEPGGGSADVEFGGGLAPESAPEVEDGEDDEVEFVNAEGDALRARDAGGSGSSPELSSGISAGAEAPSLSGPADDPDVDAEFVCPECDYRETVSGSSLRAGDICPECARGYLATE